MDEDLALDPPCDEQKLGSSDTQDQVKNQAAPPSPRNRYPQPPPRTADSTLSSSKRTRRKLSATSQLQKKDGETPDETVRRNMRNLKKQYEDLIESQDTVLRAHQDRAAAKREEQKDRHRGTSDKWRQKTASAREKRMEKSTQKIQALEARDEDDDIFINTARTLAEDFHHRRKQRQREFRNEREKNRKAAAEEAEHVLEEVCMKHRIWFPSPWKGYQTMYSPSRDLVVSSDASIERKGEHSESLHRRQLLKSNDQLPSLIKEKEAPRQREYERRQQEKQEAAAKSKEERAQKQVEVQKRVKDMIEAASEKVKNDLKKKEEACVRVARLMELKRNPRRAKAIERLVQSNPELWGQGE